MLGEQKTEQFIVSTHVNGKLIKDERIHDPFIHSTTVVGISRWDLFKALFSKQYEVKVHVSVDGTEGVIRAIMMLDPEKIEKETREIIADRKVSRESSLGNNHCYTAKEPSA